jgi:hypothetical protein
MNAMFMRHGNLSLKVAILEIVMLLWVTWELEGQK